MTKTLRSIRAVIFDLDGTLANTLDDLVASCNHAIAKFGVAPIHRDRYRYLIGQGVHYLLQHALGPTNAQHVEEGVQRHIAYYKQHMYDQSGPYDGVADMLDRLTKAQIKLAILSNKPQAATAEMASHLFGRWDFAEIWGHRENYKPKPDPASLQAVMQALQVTADQVAYVGDTKVDMLTGKAGGCFTVGVTWGFRDEQELRDHGADAIIHHPSELPALIDGE